MNCLVTGAAGFIGSHLCEQLLQAGHRVVGLDAFLPYYPRSLKEANLQGARQHPRFRFVECDLRQDNLDDLLAEVEVIFHLAAMPGLAQSWTDFDLYQSCNLTATQRLLEAARRSQSLRRLVYASTSSVYGRFSTGDESLPTRPISPYGVTKLAAEQLCRAYADEYGLPLVVLRYFSVYGPRQRPDMAYARFIHALLTGQPVVVYGDGLQVRGNTYIADCISATLAALAAPLGEIYNVGGGEAVTIREVLACLERLLGCKAHIQYAPPRPGDQRQTLADTRKLQRHLGWTPRTALEEGLARQIAWQRQLYRRHAA
jgi:nucleoside-diphosphate-sugar epimerase